MPLKLLVPLMLLLSAGTVIAADADADADAAYHTPLAGEAYRTRLGEREIDIEARDRGRTLALTLGGAAYEPPIGDQRFAPIFALYARRQFEHARLRAIMSVFYNEVDGAVDIEAPFEVVGRFTNYTVPFPQAEILDGNTIDDSAIEWGTLEGWIGVGLRYPVPPGAIDNDFRLQLFYTAGYLYTSRVHDTHPDVRLPPDTVTHGARLRLRYDALRRNLLELPHDGVALGGDLSFTHRDRWSDYSFRFSEFEKHDTRNYLKLSGYLVVASAIPSLSERHRAVLFLHGGFAPERTLDRFSAFRAGGGPFPSETDDLFRHPYPGAVFNQIPISDYVLATLEYRYEALFFLYFHLRGTIGLGNRPTLETGRLSFSHDRGTAVSAAITSGFLWDSSLYLEYAYDTSVLRADRGGSSLLFMWSKAF
jgi:hypothetical protein